MINGLLIGRVLYLVVVVGILVTDCAEQQKQSVDHMHILVVYK